MDLWLSGMGGLVQNQEMIPNRQASQNAVEMANLKSEVRELQHHIQKLALMNQALWELIRGQLNLTDEDLAKMIHDVDLRDGVEDGAITHGPLRCPQCGRISNSRHYKCLYCGLQFEKPVAE